MESRWYAYQCKSGETLFFYNTETGEHRWASCSCSRSKDPGKDMNSNSERKEGKVQVTKVSVRSIATETDHILPEKKIMKTIGTQTDDPPSSSITDTNGSWLLGEPLKNDVTFKRFTRTQNRKPSPNIATANLEADVTGERKDANDQVGHNHVHTTQYVVPNTLSLPQMVSPIDVPANKMEGRVKLFGCPLCKKAFTSASFLNKHFTNHAASRFMMTEGMCNDNLSLGQIQPYDHPIDSAEEQSLEILKDKTTIEPTADDIINKDLNQGAISGDVLGHLTNKSHVIVQEKPDQSSSCPSDVLTHECKLCKKKFVRHEELTKHKKLHRKKQPAVCKICNKAFWKLSTLKRHMELHEKEKHHMCTICEKTFSRSDAVTVHMRRIHSQEKKFKCQHCGVWFGMHKTLRSHLTKCRRTQLTQNSPDVKPILNHHDVPITKSAPHPQEQKTKQGTKNGKRFCCSCCGASYKRHKNLVIHLKKCQNVKVLWDKKEKLYKCDKCDKTFKMFKSLVHHLAVHKAKSFRCHNCNKSFDGGRGLSNHLRVCRGTAFRCKVCMKFFSRMSSLSKHIKARKDGVHRALAQHSNQKPYQMTKARSSSAKVVSSTLRTGMGEELRKHKICGKSFTEIRTLSVQRQTNSKDTGFKCTKCNTVFARMANVRRHIMTMHRDDTTFQCHMCKEAFAMAEDLVTHIRTDPRSKPHKCSHCDESFGRCLQLLSHLQIHRDMKIKNCCKLCKKAFSSPSNLCRHIKLHKCPSCSKKFPTLEEVHVHMSTCKAV